MTVLFTRVPLDKNRLCDSMFSRNLFLGVGVAAPRGVCGARARDEHSEENAVYSEWGAS